jgi:Na+-transporting NADH:ubiquinone oxidoreductase subunit E
MMLAAMRKRYEKSNVPAGLQGPGITFITIGFMAMAFVGFSGMVRVQ